MEEQIALSESDEVSTISNFGLHFLKSVSFSTGLRCRSCKNSNDAAKAEYGFLCSRSRRQCPIDGFIQYRLSIRAFDRTGIAGYDISTLTLSSGGMRVPGFRSTVDA